MDTDDSVVLARVKGRGGGGGYRGTNGDGRRPALGWP